ncbi:hypothetical protein TGAM01_v204809, partial [Trichoderma gamsii]
PPLPAIVPPSRPYLLAVSPSARLSILPQPLLLLSPPPQISIPSRISFPRRPILRLQTCAPTLSLVIFSSLVCDYLFVSRLELPVIGIHPRLAGRILYTYHSASLATPGTQHIRESFIYALTSFFF